MNEQINVGQISLELSTLLAPRIRSSYICQTQVDSHNTRHLHHGRSNFG